MVRSHGDKAPVTIGGRQVDPALAPRARSSAYVLYSFSADARMCAMSTVVKPPRPRNWRRDLLWLPRAVYIDYRTPQAKMERRLWLCTLSVLAENSLRSSAVTFRCADATGVLTRDYMKENEASEREKVKSHIPRKTDGEKAIYIVLHESST